MRRRRLNRAYFQIFFAFVLLLIVPKGASETLQGISLAVLAPALEQLHHIKRGLQGSTDVSFSGDDGKKRYARDEIQRLKLENQQLWNEVRRLKEILRFELFISLQTEEFLDDDAGEAMMRLLKLHREDLERLTEMQLQAIPALVIFRPLASWTNSMWVNVGNVDNRSLGKEIIAKNCPVVLGTSVVGVIDYVGARQSRVRLITDPGLNPSVRVIRDVGGRPHFLAKGEMRGSAATAWRGRSTILKGTGFNYDFPDQEGPARDLRTGNPVGTKDVSTLPILQSGDLLITTGMDGLFPPGLEVARVVRVPPLQEGDYFYDLEAAACVKNLNELNVVYILPPLGYDASQQPLPAGFYTQVNSKFGLWASAKAPAIGRS